MLNLFPERTVDPVLRMFVHLVIEKRNFFRDPHGNHYNECVTIFNRFCKRDCR